MARRNNSDMKAAGYLVVRAGGTVVSRHRTIRTAEAALKRYLRKKARKTDRVRAFTILNPHPIMIKEGIWAEQVRAGVVDDANGRERKAPYAAVLKIWEVGKHSRVPSRSSSWRRNSKRRSSRRRSR